MEDEVFQTTQPQSSSDLDGHGENRYKDEHFCHGGNGEIATSAATSRNHAVVVVAKCPIPGRSKTRLIPLLGEEGSSKLAKAMLSDVLVSLSKCVSNKCFCSAV